MITIEQVSKTFSSRDGTAVVALEDISLEIGRDRFVCLVGASGCGKSTLLRLVAGLTMPTSGQIRIDETPVVEPRSDTGIVFQSPTLLPWATILDNVLFPSRMMNVCTPEAVDRAHRLIDMVGLTDFKGKHPRELSGGMQQRAGICRALVHNPDILLMDEPFGALDALTREELTLELLRIWNDQPKTILFVTHSISEAVFLADQVLVMSPRPGRVADVIDVDLPRPRTFDMESHDEFQRSTRRIRNLIFGDRDR
ncbi:ABC transporter ATP-binding protein [Fodinicurvata sp. EGI_FJ10296]|uniref:ABC transporter ATP-binding protein n=1 Tax=Fodinicurvata sp. EGI_FJ10296 TaxID=3231908 RepID=UPI0034538856